MSVTAETPAHRVTGPAALSGDWRRFLNLTMTLALTDWKLRFFGSVLGYAWSLLRPLLLFGILYLVFSQIVKIGEAVPNYPLVLLIGVVLFAYFAEVTGDCVTCVVDREALVRKVSFPRMVVPLSVAVSSSFNLALNLIVVGVFVVVSGSSRGQLAAAAHPDPAAGGAGHRRGDAAGGAVRVPARHRADLGGDLAGPVLRLPRVLPDRVRDRELQRDGGARRSGQPAGHDHHRDAAPAAGPESPSARFIFGDGLYMLLPFGVLVGLTVLGFWVFNRNAPRIAEEL